MHEGSEDFSEDQESENDLTWKIKDTEITYRTKSPKTVNQYLLGEVLGKGSYGKVREALDTNTMKTVAIKIITKSQLRKLPGGGEASVRQEIALMKRLKPHPNIDLLNRAPDCCLPLRQAQSYFRDLVRGLQFLHGEGIVHRDIKPGNLMLTLNGSLKISDFGVAELLQSFDDPSYSPKSQGSPAFQPPEVASGAERFSGVKGDIWAAGITLYYVVTGRYPFEGSTVYTLFENIAKAEYQIPPSLDPDLVELIRGMLHPDKNKRFSLDAISSHKWMLANVESEEEYLEIVPSRTLFTPEFVAEMSAINDEGIHNENSGRRSPRGGKSSLRPTKRGHRRNCCILV
ncbi:Ser/Thr kinase STK, putative [Acanthamoeba castellanii str. Neff]|uniref:non-specific serine/threonine protein kinase n=1 Tax=Acanthamoeba castellanii (strain ATCC 30010 / Neff) TaxID=1257118 RepID=L8GZ55_ACACF|nr:Ser/Thr kinase STK, putative [Acanthamoeba castellanii str. Neff]ELR18227.1 Ser/Thr kinase STK, putative [Acanthamoeba castellanii str. Neff]